MRDNQSMDHHAATQHQILDAILRVGGNFAKTLGRAYVAADPENRRKIRETWPDLWEKYAKIAAAHAKANEEPT